MTEKNKKIVISGKRKTAIARAFITEGTGEIFVNNSPLKNFQFFERLRLEEPLRIAKEVLGKTDFNINIKIKGGGKSSRVDAARLAIARAITEFSKSLELKKAYLDYDRTLLVADVRRKEAYKPGDSKARRKRQKSYR